MTSEVDDQVNYDWLLKVRRTHKLRVSQIAAMCMVSRDEAAAWFCKPGTKRHRSMHRRYIKLLEDGIRKLKGIHRV